ncbi:MAG: fumarylacetoacetate hydrolase family protein [Thermoactinomyces sp.]
MKAKFRLRGVAPTCEADVDLTGNAVNLGGNWYHMDCLPWDAPVSGTVYGTLLNYKGALEALGDEVNEAPYHAPPKAPVLYIKPANTVIGYGMPIPLPQGVSQLEIGAALGVVIGSRATRVRENEALAYVAGYTVVNDVSIPHKSLYRPAIKEKARDGFCPVGPWVMERDAVENPDSLKIRVFINSKLQQENTTENLIRPVRRLIADVTAFMTLDPGDILLAGVPERAPLAKAGDQVRIEIDEVGRLENTIIPEHELAMGVRV